MNTMAVKVLFGAAVLSAAAVLAQPSATPRMADGPTGLMRGKPSEEIVVLPAGVDADAPSGWLVLELAVVVDGRSETLASEYWPPFPAPRYPSNYRYLLEANPDARWAAPYPMAVIEQDDRGHVQIGMPDPLSLIAEAQREAAEAAAAAEAEALAAEAALEGPDEADPESDEPEPVPLELIDSATVDTLAGADWLTDFEGDSDTEEPDAVAASPDSAPLVEQAPIREAALPTPFVAEAADMLAPGLAALVRETGDELVLSTRWLQPPTAANLPIILDSSGDSSEWPPLQGFLELRRGSPIRLGVNFWWNTDAAYYPESFSMAAPPRAPRRVTIIDADSGQVLAKDEAEARREQLREIIEQQAKGESIVEFVDPATGFYRDTRRRNALGELVDIPKDPGPDWPWRHVIQVADTRTLPEGSVRYFDHPVIKVVATYRELRWGEVYELGEAERDRAMLEAAVKAAENRAQP